MNLHTKITTLLVVIFALIFHANLFTQEEIVEEEEIIDEEYAMQDITPDTLNLSSFYEFLQRDESESTISECVIITDASDKEFLINKIFFKLYELKPKTELSKKINIYNCKFILDEKSPLLITDWKFSKINIVGCEFYVPTTFTNIKVESNYDFLIENCIFHDYIIFDGEENESIKLTCINNSFQTKLDFSTDLGSLRLEKNTFIYDSLKFKKRDVESTLYQLKCSNINIEDLELINNNFINNSNEHIFSIDLSSGTFGKLELISDSLVSLNLSDAEVEKSLLIDSLFVSNYIGILNFDFPEKNTNVSWVNLGKEKFSIFLTDKSKKVYPYQAKTDLQLSKTLYYNDLMSAYNKFNTLYHDRGDIRSANASYVEIKDIETRRQAYIQQVDPSLNNLINYKLNVFLRLFSDYATNPGKSLIQSLALLLIFTFIYMFSFSLWDGMNYGYYLNQYNIFTKYIISDKPIDKVIEENRNENETEETKNIKKLLKSFEEQGKKAPHILRLFGQPLHFLGKFKFDVIPGLVKLFNFQPKEWNSLDKSEKAWSGLLIFLISLIFLLYVIIVKFFNSLILSLNSFVVIGFGSLPEQENSLAMYLTIIEGIIGWFLLTIFSITLLSQVLQNT
ncbi:MAG: hypothetical protein C0595_01890 [Marinilabiliales bacterium]|nr:MAG: hypothetical protein C0595_01890 [Marinilabiliales bacterium]